MLGVEVLAGVELVGAELVGAVAPESAPAAGAAVPLGVGAGEVELLAAGADGVELLEAGAGLVDDEGAGVALAGADELPEVEAVLLAPVSVAEGAALPWVAAGAEAAGVALLVGVALADVDGAAGAVLVGADELPVVVEVVFAPASVAEGAALPWVAAGAAGVALLVGVALADVDGAAGAALAGTDELLVVEALLLAPVSVATGAAPP